MNERATSTRWDVILPVVAALIGALTLALAFLAVYAFQQRDAIVLDGRVLQLGHEAEQSLREAGTENSRAVLEQMLADGQPEVRGVALSDADGRVLEAVGSQDAELAVRKLDIFIGPSGRGGGPPADRGIQRDPSARPRGRGRLTLEFRLDPHAGTPPLSVRLLVPSAVVVAVILFAFAILGGRLLVKQQKEAALEAQRRRLEALARAGAGLAHQLRTPLATIKGSCQLIGEQLEGSPMIGRLETTVGQVGRMERMLGMLLDYARPPSPQPDDVSLGELARSLRESHPELIVGSEDAVVRADPEHVAQIVDNILHNAMTFSSGRPVELAVSKEQHEGVFVVADRGPGPGDNPEELFEPYFTTRADGTGLGLAIARNLAEANGGSLELKERSGGGCEAVLRLPLQESRS